MKSEDVSVYVRGGRGLVARLARKASRFVDSGRKPMESWLGGGF